MKIYTIATKTHEVYGHGSCGTELRICQKEVYGVGGFHPAFKTKKAAKEYLDSIKWNHNKQIVELELCDNQ